MLFSWGGSHRPSDTNTGYEYAQVPVATGIDLQGPTALGGAPAGSAEVDHHLFLRNLDTGVLRLYHEPAEHGPNTLAPGRYELIYVGWDEYGDGFPDNADPVLGCVTVEG